MARDEYAIWDATGSKSFSVALRRVKAQMSCDATDEGMLKAAKDLRKLAARAENLAMRLERAVDGR